MEGIVSLEHKEHVIATMKFDCASRRREIIQGWKEFYGPGFKQCTLIILFDEKVHYRTREDGTNFKGTLHAQTFNRFRNV